MWDDASTIEPGMQADIIAVPGNPLDEISLLETLTFVMIRGVVVKQPGVASDAGMLEQ